METNKANISTQNILGGVGAILVLLGGFIPLASIIGIVIILVALYQYSQILNDSKVFRNFLIGFLLGVAGVIIASILGIGIGGITGIISRDESVSFGIGFIVAIVIAYTIIVFASYFYRESFKALGIKLNHNLFGLAGSLIFWGAILSVIIVGFLLMLVGWIILAVAFFTAPKEVEVYS